AGFGGRGARTDRNRARPDFRPAGLPRVVTARAQTREGPRDQRQASARQRSWRGRHQGRCARRDRIRGDRGPARPRGDVSGSRKGVSERLSKSRQEIPEATIWLDVDATELLSTKRTLEERTGEKYSLLSLVARFVIAGLKKFPILNSSIDTAAGEIVTHGDINLGLAAQTPRGLMVPVIHGADRMSLRQLRDSVVETVGR